MVKTFYDIRPLDEWRKDENGFIFENQEAFVVLNVVPSAFGHVLVIPKRVVSKATDLTLEELHFLHQAKESSLHRLRLLIINNAKYIPVLYDKWAKDPKLNANLPCKSRIEAVLGDVVHGEFTGEVNIFENIGKKAGQMIDHYHLQIVPRFQYGFKGGSEAFFKHLHS